MNKESKQRLLQLELVGTNLLIQIGIFAVCYFLFYSTWFRLAIEKGFWLKGHILLLAIYTFLLISFSNMYGAFKMEYQRNVDLILSQIFGTLVANVLEYAILSLLCMQLMNVVYYIPMMLVQLAWASVWIVFSAKIYAKKFPPRELLLVHGDRPIEDILRKFESRKDRYTIYKTMNISEGVENICLEALNGYDGVVIWDIPTNFRNNIYKFCYGKSIRVYIMPKISDVMLSGAEELHLFDSPMLLTRENALSFEQTLIKDFLI